MTGKLQSKMDEMTRQQKAALILTLIGHEAKRNSPDSFRAFMVGMLGNFVNAMSDSAFEQFCSVHRCDQIGCNCHVIAEAATGFFKLLREDVKQEFSRRTHQSN